MSVKTVIRIILAAVLTIHFFSFSVAQEKSRSEEILRYFPDSIYVLISHSDLNRAENEEAYRLFDWMMNRDKTIRSGRARPTSPLPEDLQDKENSRTEAQQIVVSAATTRLKKPANDEERRNLFNELSKRYPGGVRRFEPTGETDEEGMQSYEITYNSGDHLFVLRYDDVAGFVESALESGTLKETDQKIRKKPVYAFRGMYSGNRASDYAAYATDFEELLIARKVDSLRSMVVTAEGLEPGILENPDYVDLIDLIQGFGHQWNVQFRSATTKEILGYIQNNDQLTDQQKKQRKENILRSPVFYANWFDISQELSINSVSIYREEQYVAAAIAKARQTEVNSDSTVSEAKFRNMMKSRTRIWHDGKRLYKSMVIDLELARAGLKNQKERIATWEKRQDEQKAQKKEQAKEKEDRK